MFFFVFICFFGVKAQKVYIPKISAIKAKIENVPADGIIPAEDFKKISKIILEGSGSENYRIISCDITLKLQGQPVVLTCTPHDGELTEETKACLQKDIKILFIDNIVVLDKSLKKTYMLENVIKLKAK